MTDAMPDPAVPTGASDPSDLERRAAHAYAEVLLAPDAAGPAAEDALGAYAQTLGPGGVGADPETLLALTRLMTAVSLPDRSRPEDRRRAVWASIDAAAHCTCREAGPLLATRANGALQPREAAALEEHLAGCADCRALAGSTELAEAAFRRVLAPPRTGMPLTARPTLLGALAALAVAGGAAAALAGGGSDHRAHAAVVPVQTQAPSRFAAAPARVAHPAVHHRSHAAIRRPPTRPAARTAAVPTPTVAAEPAPTSTGAAATPTPVSPPAVTAVTHPPATRSSAPPPAAASGPSSLPAESAPQQGIGTLTTGG